MLLEVEDLRVHYGKIEAIRGISIEVDEGEIVTLIGANGAGKTTTLKTLSGLRRVSSGRVRFDGERHHRRARAQAGAAGDLPGAGGPRDLPAA